MKEGRAKAARPLFIYLRTNSTPRVPGPQWQETVQSFF